MKTIITITKDNSDEVEGQKFFDLMVDLFKDEPDVKISGAVLNTHKLEMTPT